MLRVVVLLLAFTSIQASRLLCQYYGSTPLIPSSTLAGLRCDVLINRQGYLSSSGKFALDNTIGAVTASLQSMNCLYPSTQIYFGLDICRNPLTPDISPEQYKKSVEEAMEWAKNSDYNGIFINLCKINSINKDIVKTIMDKVRSFSGDVSLSYSFILPKPTMDFDISTHSRANFIVVSPDKGTLDGKAYLEAGHNVTGISDFWTAKGVNISTLIFDIEPMTVATDYSTGSLTIKYLSKACIGAEAQADRNDTVRMMIDDYTKLADDANTKGFGGVFMNDLDYDDVNGDCGNGTMLLTRTLRRLFR